MKRLPGILIALSLLTALFVGCEGSHDARATAELDRADSLLCTSDTAAHSAALRQMLALDTARALQTDEALRARHALLLVQARYKCYVTIPADSALIDQARRYYADHHSGSADHERYTRALIYSGAVAEELGHPQQALQWYLEAESAADPADHFNLGFVNLRMATLFSSFYDSSGSSIEHYMKAYRHFVKSGDLRYQGICLGNMGAILRITDNKTAKVYLRKGIELMKKVGDCAYLNEFTISLAKSYLIDKNLTMAKSTIHEVLPNDYYYINDDIYYITTQIFLMDGNIDSALCYFNKANPNPTDQRSVAIRLQTSRLIEQKRGNLSKVAEITSEYESLINKLDDNPLKNKLINAEKNQQEKDNDEKNRGISHLSLLIKALVLIFIFILFTLFFLYKQNQKKWKSAILQLNNENANKHSELLNTIKEMSSQVDVKDAVIRETKKNVQILEKNISNHINVLKRITELSSKNTKLTQTQAIKEIMNLHISDAQFWQELEYYVDYSCNHIIEYCRNEFLSLSDNDIHIIELICCDFSYIEIAYMMGYKNPNFISNKRKRIAAKMKLDKSLEAFIKGFKD